MRALTGYDRVTLVCGDQRAESSRGNFSAPNSMDDLPAIIADTGSEPISLFPRDADDSSILEALMCSGSAGALARLRDQDIRATLRVPFEFNGTEGEFRCDSRAPREPCFEMHAAAELFAQLFAMQLEIDRLR